MSFDWQDGGAGWITAAGQRLEYATFGPAPDTATTLVLLHEGLGCVALWRDIPQQLAALTGCGVFVYSRQGYGRSEPARLPRPLDYMTREAVDVLPHVLDGIGLRRAVLIGHSDGASIAAIYGGTLHDPRVAGLVLIAPHFFTEPHGLAAIRRARAEFDSGALAQRLGKYHNEAAHSFSGWADSWLNPDFALWNIEEVLDGITCPVLAIQAEGDPYGTLAQIDVITRRCPGPVERLILPGTGHAPHLEAPQEVLPAVANFCTKVQNKEGLGVK